MAQQPASYLVLKYERPVVKLTDSGEIAQAPAPLSVLEGSRADISLLVGILLDKFLYHLPLYRQHQRMVAQGLRVSRSWLTDLVQRSIFLLGPIYEAQLESIRQSRVLTLDETPIKAGLSGKGKMHQGYFWPVMGERQEICFPYAATRGTMHIEEVLGKLQPGTVLLSDGYAAYARFQKENEGLIAAQCWSHSRREFVKAEKHEPERVSEALRQICEFYRIEEEIQEKRLTGQPKREYRHAYPAFGCCVLPLGRPPVHGCWSAAHQSVYESPLLRAKPQRAASGFSRRPRRAHRYESHRATDSTYSPRKKLSSVC